MLQGKSLLKHKCTAQKTKTLFLNVALRWLKYYLMLALGDFGVTLAKWQKYNVSVLDEKKICKTTIN